MRIAAVVLAAGLLAACGGSDSDDDVLHLRTGDYTESELRTEIRSGGNLTETNCAAIRDLPPEEVLDVLAANGLNATPVQTPNADDDLRQAEIVIEECERAFP